MEITNILFDINKNDVLSLSSCLAKTIKHRINDTVETVPGADVLTHCVIVGEVAKELIRRFIPALREKYFPRGSELIAAAHDLGKVSPAFQEKLRRSFKGYIHNSCPKLKLADPSREEQWGFHPGLSKITLKKISGKYIPDIVGCHHGYASDPPFSSNADVIGGQEWQQYRVEILEKLKAHFACDWPVVRDDLHAVVLAGLTCIADWIGSGSDFVRVRHLEDIKDLQDQVAEAVTMAGFTRPIMKRGLSFQDIFKNEPRPVQAMFIESVSSPGIYVLEAPMGIGKTEAAFYAAYKIFSMEKAAGIYFALPTKLTSNKIFARMKTFLEKVLDEKSPFKETLLLHSSAWLYEFEMGDDGPEDASWFYGNKKGLLAPFAVGTIDQALQAVMNVKHNFVRAFGLAGKAVIIDEVHSYDSYTGTILDVLIKRLREMDCTVIILSATLTGERRRKLLDIDNTTSTLPSAYPLISSMPGEHGELQEIAVSANTEQSAKAEEEKMPGVSVHRIKDDGDALEEALMRAEQGQQVLWIENTVDEAQERYCSLNSRAAELEKIVEVGLIHSRFMQYYREENENYWLNILGKEGKEKRREKGRILVGTQVLEQSLDIDADFLVTRLCPTDMLLQRIGRLWRHRANDPERPGGSKAEVWILAADYEEIIKHKGKLGQTVKIYDPYVLLRTLELWDRITLLHLPEDIRPCIEATYTKRTESSIVLSKLEQNMEKKRAILSGRARLGLSVIGKKSDNRAESRYSEIDNQDVLLLSSFTMNNDGSITLVWPENQKENNRNEDTSGYTTLYPGLRCGDKNERKTWKECAATVNLHIVSVHSYQSPQTVLPCGMDVLGEYVYLGSKKDEESLLQVALVNNNEKITGFDHVSPISTYNLSYNSVIGYRAERKSVKEDIDDEW